MIVNAAVIALKWIIGHKSKQLKIKTQRTTLMAFERGRRFNNGFWHRLNSPWSKTYSDTCSMSVIATSIHFEHKQTNWLINIQSVFVDSTKRQKAKAIKRSDRVWLRYDDLLRWYHSKHRSLFELLQDSQSALYPNPWTDRLSPWQCLHDQPLQPYH